MIYCSLCCHKIKRTFYEIEYRGVPKRDKLIRCPRCYSWLKRRQHFWRTKNQREGVNEENA